jgi:threonine synthase
VLGPDLHLPNAVLRCGACGALARPDEWSRCGDCAMALEVHYPQGLGNPPRPSSMGPVPYAPVLPASAATLSRIRLAPTPLCELPRRPRTPCAYGKVEGANPTGSAKDPMAVVALSFLVDRGIREFVFTSTGNTAASYAWALVAFPELTATLVVAEGFPVPVRRPANLTVIEAPGTYAQAHAHARATAVARGIHYEEGFFSVGRREGLKTAYLDALLEMAEPPTVIVQSISSGMGLLAADRAIDHLLQQGTLLSRPRLIGVQQQTCAPMASAFAAGASTIRPQDKVLEPSGICVATLLGDPSSSYADVLRVVRRSGGSIIAVPDQAARTARIRLQRAGLDPCMASSLATGAVECGLERGLLDADDRVLVMLSGSSRSIAGQAELDAERNLRPKAAIGS